MNSRTEAIVNRLSECHPKGFDLSLGRITGLLEKIGNPHLRIPPAIHVAGTNGKGSTIAFSRAILEAAGYKVHVHTSPHLVSWSERYRLAGELATDDMLADAVTRIAEANDRAPITIFEIMSAVMFLLFSEHDADFSLVEVGLGGRFDATNVIEKPVVSVITPIALDHQAYLGNTLEKITFEKAGIIKRNVPVVVGPQQDAAREVIEDRARRLNAPVSIAQQDFDFYRDATGFVFQDETGLLDLPVPSLIGEFQLANAATAIAALRAAQIELSDQAIRDGLRNARWPGRMEKLPDGEITRAIAISETPPEVWIDGGHNPAGGQVIASELSKRLMGRKLLMICGMINTKDPVGYFTAFSALNPHVITVPINSSDAGIDPEELAAKAGEAGLKTTACATVSNALTIVREHLQKYDEEFLVLLCGSLYFVGEILDRNGTPPS